MDFQTPPSETPAKPKLATVFEVSGAISVQPGSKKGTLPFSNAGLTKPVKFNLKLTLNGKSKTVKFTLKPPKT